MFGEFPLLKKKKTGFLLVLDVNSIYFYIEKKKNKKKSENIRILKTMKLIGFCPIFTLLRFLASQLTFVSDFQIHKCANQIISLFVINISPRQVSITRRDLLKKKWDAG